MTAKLFSFIFLPLILLAYPIERNFQAFYNFNLDTPSYSHACVDFQLVKPYQDTLFIINPKLKYYLDDSFDVGGSIGIRKSIYNDVIGSHIFINTSLNPFVSFNQSGISLEYLRNGLDLRYNFYLPFPGTKVEESYIWTSHKWNEIELTKHFPEFSLTIGSFFDFTEFKPAGRIKFSFPFEKTTFIAGVNIDTNNTFTPFFGICFNFYKLDKANECKPISYSQRVWCDGKPYVTYTSKKPIEKPEYNQVIDVESEPEGENAITKLIDTENQKSEFPESKAPQKTGESKGFWENLFADDESRESVSSRD